MAHPEREVPPEGGRRNPALRGGSGETTQKADPALRRRVLGLVGVLALAGVFAVLRLDSYLTELQTLARSSAVEAAERTLVAARLFLATLALGATVLGVFLGRLSWRTLRAGRYPAPGTRVISDTRVLRGRNARIHGGCGLILAVLLVAAGLAVPYRIYRGLSALLEPTLKATPVSPADLGLE